MYVLKKTKTASFVGLFAAIVSANLHAEMQSLSDNDLSEVDGQGIGLVMEDFVFSHGHVEGADSDQVFRITGVTNEEGQPVVINVNQLYIARAGSDFGSNLEGVNLGRLNNPYKIDLLDGNDIGLAGKSVLEFSAPSKVDIASGYDCLDASAGIGSGECSSRPAGTTWDNGGVQEVWENGERPDMGLELQINDGANSANLNFNVQSAVFDGSYLRLWGDDEGNRLAAEFRLNFYTPELRISTCGQGSDQDCSSNIKMKDFRMELALGHTFQPLYIGVNSDTGDVNPSLNGGLTLEIAAITHEYLDNIDLTTGYSDGTPQGDAAYAFFQDYYENPDYRSDIVIGDLEVGGVSLGEQRIEGVLIQYMDVNFRDIGSN